MSGAQVGGGRRGAAHRSWASVRSRFWRRSKPPSTPSTRPRTPPRPRTYTATRPEGRPYPCPQMLCAVEWGGGDSLCGNGEGVGVRSGSKLAEPLKLAEVAVRKSLARARYAMK